MSTSLTPNFTFFLQSKFNLIFGSPSY